MALTHPLMTVSKGYRPLVKAALAQGWTLTQSNRGHPKLTAPDGYSCPIPGSGRDASLVKSITSRLRKHGVVL